MYSMSRTTRTTTARPNKKKPDPAYIFVVGGVMSGVGKGITSSSIAKVLQARGLKVTALKIDPYINVDAGTMNPTEHGEVFVLKDGLETDQDMGNYERFLNVDLPADNYMTTGSVYQSVIARERSLGYKGKNVQVVPDIPREVIGRIERAQQLAEADVTIVEIGGTIGEYENILFLEAVRMMKSELRDKVGVVMVSYLPVPGSIGEMKTKPTQHAARTLGSAGVQADIIIARSLASVDKKRKEKIATFCNVYPEDVISAPDVGNIYEIPLNFEKDKLSDRLCELLALPCAKTGDLRTWKQFVNRSKNTKQTIQIAVVGKYFSSGDFVLSDVYISILEAIKYSAYHTGIKPEITYLSAADFEGDTDLSSLDQFDGILVPGGFGNTGVPGKLRVVSYAREHGIPYFGICYGMQLAVVEYARSVAGFSGANSAEIDKRAADLVIDVLPEQKDKIAQGDMGGSMRLGQWETVLKKGTIARAAYGTATVSERHRHRYEVNPEYVSVLEEAGLVFSGTSQDGRLMEIVELPEEQHPFFVGVQFHPELQARPLRPHPLFSAFVAAAGKRATKK